MDLLGPSARVQIYALIRGMSFTNCTSLFEFSALKDPKNKKVIAINPIMKVQTEGDVLLDYKFLGR